ncbi:MAG: hypothetical protein MUC83_13985 [Pirellula sp.]|nr:hypothetical protein [Pirellula sp.]
MNKLMHRIVLIAITLGIVGTGLSQNLEAKQFLAHKNGREVVVHTNPLPVIFHRLLPPNHGRHISASEYYGRSQSRLIPVNVRSR